MEEALQEGGDEASPILRFEAPFLQPYVAAVLQYPQDAGVGRGPADAEFLHLLDQARLGVARRRLREMLFGRNVLERDALALLHRSEEHTSELQSLMRISYAVFCLKKKKTITMKTKNSKSVDQHLKTT